jgi:hypothetical protein
VGAIRNHPHLHSELVGSLPQRLVLKICGAGVDCRQAGLPTGLRLNSAKPLPRGWLFLQKERAPSLSRLGGPEIEARRQWSAFGRVN